jgi:hypothetical protein
MPPGSKGAPSWKAANGAARRLLVSGAHSVGIVAGGVTLGGDGGGMWGDGADGNGEVVGDGDAVRRCAGELGQGDWNGSDRKRRRRRFWSGSVGSENGGELDQGKRGEVGNVFL